MQDFVLFWLAVLQAQAFIVLVPAIARALDAYAAQASIVKRVIELEEEAE